MSNPRMENSHYWNARFATLAGITLIAALSRLIPHPPNATPIGAIALFGGVYFASKRAAFAVPFIAIAISNAVLAVVRYGGSAFPVLPYVYLSFALTVGLGILIRRQRSGWAIFSAGMLSALIFFAVSNFGVWLRGELYPRTLEGFIACYVAAIPYTRHMIVANAVYVPLLFGTFELAKRVVPSLREETAPVTVATGSADA